jgi:pimeloyl-ACP methyl ester carboxylesterase
MRLVENRDVILATQSFGAPGNTPVLLVMGSTASMLGWPDLFCDLLAGQSLYVIRFDHRDTGRSTTLAPAAASYAVEDMADDVLAIADAYGLGRLNLVGMSLGGYISQMLAVSRPDRIASLTLIGSEPLGWDGPPLPHISDAFMAHFRALGALDWSDGVAVTEFLVESERLCAGSGAPFDAEAAKALALRVLARTDSPASMFNHGSLTTRQEWTGGYRKIACPVLVIHGAEDPILPIGNGLALAEGVSGARIEVMPGVGHELPQRCFAALADWIAAHVRTPRE